MAKPLDFRKTKKNFLTVTLNDDDNTTLLIGTPTKAIMSELFMIQEALQDIASTEEASEETLDYLYRVCARLMSRNRNKKQITSEFLAEIFDLEDIIIFFNGYMDFITEITNSKN